MNIEKALSSLSAIENDWVIPPRGFGMPDSYRGYYDEVAFPPSSTASVSDMVAYLWLAKSGKTFTGYKGGDYIYDDSTPCHLAWYGMCGLKEGSDNDAFERLISDIIIEAKND